MLKIAMAVCLLFSAVLVAQAPDSFGNNKGTLLEGALGAVALLPTAFEGLTALGTEELAHEIPALFDPAEENQWDQQIAFEEPSLSLSPQPLVVAALDAEELNAIKETLTFQSLKKVDVDPDTFDVKPLEEEHDPLFGESTIDRLTTAEIAVLEELFEEETVINQVILSTPKMLYIGKEELNPALDHNDRSLLKGTLLPTSGKPTLYVKAPAFYIDLQPVTNGEYAPFVSTSKALAPRHWLDGKIPDGHENKPVVNVSYKDASAYAAWIGKRIPTEIEWSRARRRGLVPSSGMTLKEWTATPASANSKMILSGGAFQPRNENWFDHTTSFRTAAD